MEENSLEQIKTDIAEDFAPSFLTQIAASTCIKEVKALVSDFCQEIMSCVSPGKDYFLILANGFSE